MTICKLAAIMAALADSTLAVGVDPEDPEALTGIYVEYWVPPSGNPCGSSPPSVGDGWFAVPGFPSRGATCPGATPQNGLAYGSNVSFTGNAGASYRVFAVDSAQAIGSITVSGSGFTLIVGRSSLTNPPFTNPTVPLVTPGGGAIGAISAPGGTVQVRSTGVVTSVSANSIVRIDARNGIGTVDSATTIFAVRAPRITGNVSAAGTITSVLIENWDSGNSTQDYTSVVSSSSSSVQEVLVSGARVLGAVTADQGAIGVIGGGSVVGIGPAAGTPAVIRAQNGIERITAPSINATITANHNGGTGQIQTLQATTGTFAGSLHASDVGASGTGLTVSGAMSANVTVTGDVRNQVLVGGASSGTIGLGGTISQPVTFNGGVSAGSVALGTVNAAVIVTGSMARPLTIGAIGPSGSVRIGGSLSGTLNVAAGGLQGRAVVNAASGTGTWTGSSSVGTIALSPLPDYIALSASLGGGAVGHVPFRLHNQDCIPENSTSSPASVLNSRFCHVHTAVSDCGGTVNYDDQSIILTHYGPIAPESATLPPFTCFADGNTATDYAQFMRWEIVNDGTSRRLEVYGDPDQQVQFVPGRYRVFPVRTGTTNRLLCAGMLPGAPATPVADYEYVFDIVRDCNRNGVDDAVDISNGWPDAMPPFDIPDCCHGFPVCDPDFDQDGNVNQDDVQYLTNVLAGGSNPSGRDPDFNGDGNADQDDLAALVNRVAGGACP